MSFLGNLRGFRESSTEKICSLVIVEDSVTFITNKTQANAAFFWPQM